jgi:hypothetical protein
MRVFFICLLLLLSHLSFADQRESIGQDPNMAFQGQEQDTSATLNVRDMKVILGTYGRRLRRPSSDLKEPSKLGAEGSWKAPTVRDQ